MTSSNILLVEDEGIIAKSIQKRLKGLGYSVVGLGSSGEEGIQLASQLQPDLILMDIHLGSGMNGIEAADIIRRQMDLPVVYLTAHSDNGTIQRAKYSEPYGYILKPADDKDLQIAIEMGLYKHQMERRLRENEQWLAATLGSIGDGVIATDENGRVRLMNALAERLTGWTQSEASGKEVEEVFEILERNTRKVVSNPAMKALETGRVALLDDNTILRSKNGTEYPIDDNAAPIRDAEGNISGAVLVFRDITERCRLEEHLRQAQKMEALGRLAGGIAHDFNNIMTIITGYSDLLLRNPTNQDISQEFLRQINMAGKRAAGLTRQILAFSRKQILTPSLLDLNKVLIEMSHMIQRLIHEDIELVRTLDPEIGTIKADRTQLEQVILNLALNARDAMPRGGKLILATSKVLIGDQVVHDLDYLKPGQYVQLKVSDTGCGMSQDIIDHVFEPFFTTKEVGKGTGLGLASVYGTVKQSGGHIIVDSSEGIGTTFRIFLPVVKDLEPQPEVQLVDERQVAKGTETILLIEDNAAVRKLTKTVLQSCGYKVLETSQGPEAIALSDSYQDTIHLLITDLVMPIMSGNAIAEELAKRRPEMKVIYMSGYNEETIIQKGIDSTKLEFIQKPFRLDVLTKKIREVLDHNQKSRV